MGALRHKVAVMLGDIEVVIPEGLEKLCRLPFTNTGRVFDIFVERRRERSPDTSTDGLKEAREHLKHLRAGTSSGNNRSMIQIISLHLSSMSMA